MFHEREYRDPIGGDNACLPQIQKGKFVLDVVENRLSDAGDNTRSSRCAQGEYRLTLARRMVGVMLERGRFRGAIAFW